MEVELFVKLVIPDNVAITAFNTVKSMGYNIEELKRENYYKFTVDSDNGFSEKIGKVDVLVNANKNKFTLKKEKDDSVARVLVKNFDDDCKDLLSVLKNRLGFKNIQKMEQGTLWTIKPKELSEEIAKELLVNPNYQEFTNFHP